MLARLLAAGLVALALWLNQAINRPSAPPPAPPPAPAAQPTAAGPEAAPAPAAETSPVGFRDGERLAEHFRKHGAEFGAITEAEYLRRAQWLRDRPAGGEILEGRRADGVVTRFDRGAGAFLAFDPDLTIRTYFRPNDGEAYFRRQLKRPAGTP